MGGRYGGEVYSLIRAVEPAQRTPNPAVALIQCSVPAPALGERSPVARLVSTAEPRLMPGNPQRHNHQMGKHVRRGLLATAGCPQSGPHTTCPATLVAYAVHDPPASCSTTSASTPASPSNRAIHVDSDTCPASAP